MNSTRRTRRKLRVTIRNRSDWPDEFANVVVPWVCAQAGIDRPYFVDLWPSSGHWSGRGGWDHQTTLIGRRYYKPDEVHEHKDHRFKHHDEHVMTGNIEAFVYIVAHEAFHATEGHPDKFTKNGRCDKVSMEWWCDHWAYRVVKKFRTEWPKTLRRQVASNFRRSIRARRTRERQHLKRLADAKHRLSDEYKLATARKLLKQWETKRKLASTKVRKYRQRVRYYDRKAASSPENSPPTLDSPG